MDNIIFIDYLPPFFKVAKFKEIWRKPVIIAFSSIKN